MIHSGVTNSVTCELRGKGRLIKCSLNLYHVADADSRSAVTVCMFTHVDRYLDPQIVLNVIANLTVFCVVCRSHAVSVQCVKGEQAKVTQEVRCSVHPGQHSCTLQVPDICLMCKPGLKNSQQHCACLCACVCVLVWRRMAVL